MNDKMPEMLIKKAFWGSEQLSKIVLKAENTIPLITALESKAILPGLDLWDLWPVQLKSGEKAAIAGGVLWMILAAPALPDPNERHGVARIRLVLEKDGAWHDFGYFMPEGFCPGQREWAGSAVFDPHSGRVTLYYTVAGRRGDVDVGFEQRLFDVSAALHVNGDKISFSDWRSPREIIQAEGHYYTIVDGSQCVPGFIKGFRDPAYFCDSADGQEYVVFTASRAQSADPFNGCIGIARAVMKNGVKQWQIMPPIVDADGVNNELERPHIVAHNGLYYIFWSTQRHMFSPTLRENAKIQPPTGLYGMVGESLYGPYRALNESGLVAAVPEAESRQSYSWWVCGDLSVVSFVDHWGLKGRDLKNNPTLNRAQFGGTPAPVFNLNLKGDCAKIVTLKAL